MPRHWWRVRLIGLYLLVAVALPLLRWAHCWPVAAASWWWVTLPWWGPWVPAGLGWGLHLYHQRRRRR